MLAAGASGILMPLSGLNPLVNPNRKRSLRIAHLTDIHVQPERGAEKGMEAALEHAQGQSDKPDLIFTGGDLIMDAFGADEARTKVQWDIFTRVLKSTVEVPIEHTIGNHDVWGWGNRSKFEKDSRFGKRWACDVLGLDKPYRSFDRAGWHFIVLDSTFPKGTGEYTARLDDEQFEWLQSDLKATPAETPIFVISHIPILAVCAMFDGENEKTGNWVIPGAWVHIDARRIKDLFRKHPNVKVCISGHEHLIDQVVYNGVTYFCNGAVSGAWWGGDYHECTYGYAQVDLFDDGSFENRYVPYGWKTVG
jgi:3',5'-cyclic AMP phosphodiesterase CpdA